MQDRDKEHRNVVCLRLQNFLPPHHATLAAANQNPNTPGSGFGFEEGDDSSKSSKQSSRKSSSVIASQSKSQNDKLQLIQN